MSTAFIWNEQGIHLDSRTKAGNGADPADPGLEPGSMCWCEPVSAGGIDARPHALAGLALKL
jgi:hypothetical protein